VLRQTVRCEKKHAKDASAIVFDLRTGAVLPMAQAPGCDANDTSLAAAAAELSVMTPAA
jgi:cell division protein FtsI/penicillin-binding protein 2